MIDWRAAIVSVSLAALAVHASAQNTNGQPAATHPHFMTPEQRRDIAAISLAEGVSIGALIEIEAAAGREHGESFSDIVLATFELGIEAELNDRVTANALLLWEEGETEPVDLDEAAIRLDFPGTIPLSLKAGLLYLPFGRFSSHFVSDPLTLELAETRNSSVLLGYSHGGMTVQIGAFNGELDEEGENNDTCDIVASITLSKSDSYTVGASWISDAGESECFREGLADIIAGTSDCVVPGPGGLPVVESGAAPFPYDAVAGAACFATLELGPFSLEGEYITALQSFDTGLLSDRALQPSAWNTEIALLTDVGTDLEFALRYEGSDELPDFPERQYGIAISMQITEGTTLAAEFLHGEFDAETEDRNVTTLQLAVEL